MLVAHIKINKIIFPLIHNILTCSIFPRQWKVAKVVPIAKRNFVNSMNDLRPISILPVLSKVVEHIVKHQMMLYLDSNNLINSYQCGFRKNCNTSSLLLGLTDTIRNSLNIGCISVLVSLDLSKAFDRVSPYALVVKLCDYFAFSRMACKFFYSYLTERSQFVSINDNSSDLMTVTSGVPQGSVLGPLLFILYTNDMFTVIERFSCKAFIFADDFQLLFSDEPQSTVALEENINHVLTDIVNWMTSSNLCINPSKTKAMIFKPLRSMYTISINIQGVQIGFVETIKCLGLIIDSNLNFTAHINCLSSKINFTLRKLYSLNLYLPLFVRKRMAHALLLSNLWYCAEVFTGTTSYVLNKYQLLFNKVVRFVYSLRVRTHITNYVVEFLGCNFKNFLHIRLLLQFYKIIKNNFPCFLRDFFVFSNSVRNPQLLFPRIRNSFQDSSFNVRIVRIWNNLPRDLRTFLFSVRVFKDKLLEYARYNNL